MVKRLLLSFICLALIFSIAGCSGPTPDKSVKNFFDALGKQDMEAANSYLVNQNQKLGRDMILRLVYSRIKYEVVSSSINKNRAVVKTKVAAPDLVIIIENMYKDLFSQLYELTLSDPESVETKSAQLAEEYFNKALSDPNVPMVTSEVDIDLMRNSSTKKWQIVGNSKLTDAISGNFSTAMSNLYNINSDTVSQESTNLSPAYNPMGQEVLFRDGTLAVIKAELSSGNDDSKPNSGCDFTIVTVHIKNNTDKQIGYSPAFFVLETTGGDFLQPIYSEVDKGTHLYMTWLKAGEEIEGTLVYEHKSLDLGKYLYYTDFDGETPLAAFELSY